MKRNIFKTLVASATLALTAFACGSKAETKVDENAPVTIKYWSFPNFTSDSEFKTPEEYDKALIAAFEAKFDKSLNLRILQIKNIRILWTQIA